MSNKQSTARTLAALALATALVVSACGAKNDEGVGQGTVLSVDTAAGLVTIEHGDIPGVMMAMTMTFEVADPSLLSGIAGGQRVEFRVAEEGGRYVIHEIVQK